MAGSLTPYVCSFHLLLVHTIESSSSTSLSCDSSWITADGGMQNTSLAHVPVSIKTNGTRRWVNSQLKFWRFAINCALQKEEGTHYYDQFAFFYIWSTELKEWCIFHWRVPSFGRRRHQHFSSRRSIQVLAQRFSRQYLAFTELHVIPSFEPLSMTMSRPMKVKSWQISFMSSSKRERLSNQTITIQYLHRYRSNLVHQVQMISQSIRTRLSPYASLQAHLRLSFQKRLRCRPPI